MAAGTCTRDSHSAQQPTDQAAPPRRALMLLPRHRCRSTTRRGFLVIHKSQHISFFFPFWRCLERRRQRRWGARRVALLPSTCSFCRCCCAAAVPLLPGLLALALVHLPLFLQAARLPPSPLLLLLLLLRGSALLLMLLPPPRRRWRRESFVIWKGRHALVAAAFRPPRRQPVRRRQRRRDDGVRRRPALGVCRQRRVQHGFEAGPEVLLWGVGWG